MSSLPDTTGGVQASSGLTVRAPAKVNLSLSVLSRRADGYHDLETLMVAISLQDTLTFRAAHKAGDPGHIGLNVRLSPQNFVRHPDAGQSPPASRLAAGSDNLVWKAADLFRREAGVSAGVTIDLVKRIPWQAGLAGGSSDAAATLKGLNRFWGIDWPLSRLRELGARLGSDIPFFLGEGSAAICRGRGELVEPVNLRRSLPLVVVKPPSGLSTPLVFRHCTPEGTAGTDSLALVDDLQAGRIQRGVRRMHNTLQGPAEQLNEDVRRTREAFERLPFLGHRMSGSGTSWFGVCRSLAEARLLGTRLRQWNLGSVFVVRTLV